MINRLLLVDPDADISTAKSCIVDIADLDKLEWTIKRQNTKIAVLEELVDELRNKIEGLKDDI